MSTVRDRCSWISLFGDDYGSHMRLGCAQERLSRTNRRRDPRKAPPIGRREAAAVAVNWHLAAVVW